MLSHRRAHHRGLRSSRLRRPLLYLAVVLTLEAAAYFVVTEGLGNVLKHADAHRAGVCLQADGSLLRIEVRDDGRGFDADTVLLRGLVGLRDRVETMGGSLTVTSGSSGTTLTACMPAAFS